MEHAADNLIHAQSLNGKHRPVIEERLEVSLRRASLCGTGALDAPAAPRVFLGNSRGDRRGKLKRTARGDHPQQVMQVVAAGHKLIGKHIER